jgi:hypothetical protein
MTVSANRLQRPLLGQHRISESSHARTAEQICNTDDNGRRGVIKSLQIIEKIIDAVGG